jgi:hypothetical protein
MHGAESHPGTLPNHGKHITPMTPNSHRSSMRAHTHTLPLPSQDDDVCRLAWLSRAGSDATPTEQPGYQLVATCVSNHHQAMTKQRKSLHSKHAASNACDEAPKEHAWSGSAQRAMTRVHFHDGVGRCQELATFEKPCGWSAPHVPTSVPETCTQPPADLSWLRVMA